MLMNNSDDLEKERKDIIELEFIRNLITWLYRNETEQLCFKRGKEPREIPYLCDLIYRYKKFINHINRFDILYCQLEEEIISYSNGVFDTLKDKENRLFQIILPAPPDLMYELEGILSEAKKCIETSIRVLLKDAEPNTHFEYIHLDKISKGYQKDITRQTKFVRILSQNYPLFVRELMNQWVWIQNVKNERTNLEHITSLAKSFIDAVSIYKEGKLETLLQTVSLSTVEEGLIIWINTIEKGVRSIVRKSLMELIASSKKGTENDRIKIDEIFLRIRLREYIKEAGKIPCAMLKIEPLHEGFINDPQKIEEMIKSHQIIIKKSDRLIS